MLWVLLFFVEDTCVQIKLILTKIYLKIFFVTIQPKVV